MLRQATTFSLKARIVALMKHKYLKIFAQNFEVFKFRLIILFDTFLTFVLSFLSRLVYTMLQFETDIICEYTI